MKIVLASNNAHKLREMREILDGTGIELIGMREAGADLEPEENGLTFEENARIKASACVKATGLPSLSDDSGICIDALAGLPGIYSSRFLGELSYPEKCQRIIRLLENYPVRTARYACSVVLVFPDGREFTAFGTTEGTIAEDQAGDGGFGYDPMFIVEGDGRHMAELSEDEKNAISHRGRAVRALLDKLKENEIC